MNPVHQRLEEQLREQAPRGPLAGGGLRRRVLAGAIAGAARRQRAARRAGLAIAAILAAAPAVALLASRGQRAARFAADSVARGPLVQHEDLPTRCDPLAVLTGAIELPNQSRALVHRWLASAIAHDSGGTAGPTNTPPEAAPEPAPRWDDPRTIVAALVRPNEIPLLLALMSCEEPRSRILGKPDR